MVIDNLTEVHCHILPGIDDGSPDVETSVKMIELLKAQGAKTIVLTPHYYTDTISYDDFIARRDNALARLKAALPPDSPRLIPAAEVYVTNYLLNYPSLDGLKIGNSDYVLVEHAFTSRFSQDVYDRLVTLGCEYGVKPILAHIERYPALMDDEELLDDYLDMGCLAQVNISSFVNAPRSTRKRLFKYLESGRVHLIGSDCHNLTSRRPEYEKGIKEIIKKSGREAVDVLERNAAILTR